MSITSVGLSPANEEFVQDALAKGVYASRQQLLDEAVELLKKRERLRGMIQEGLDELDRGEGIPGDEVFARLEARAEEISRSAKRKKQ